MSELLSPVRDYYALRLRQFGYSPQGVDWNSEESQTLRFDQLAKVIDCAAPYSINDLGCGYGALAGYLSQRCPGANYCGIDISSAMVEAARSNLPLGLQARFEIGAMPSAKADYGIASGIFNVRLENSEATWARHIETTLDALDATSSRGFSFNCLTSYSDTDKMRDHLYYADPSWLFDLCKRCYSRNVALLHDYGLYEFTILVRKN